MCKTQKIKYPVKKKPSLACDQFSKTHMDKKKNLIFLTGDIQKKTYYWKIPLLHILSFSRVLEMLPDQENIAQCIGVVALGMGCYDQGKTYLLILLCCWVTCIKS